MRRFAFLLLALPLLSSPALAQEDTSALNERLERLERDVNFVQKQVYRGGAAQPASNAAPLPANAGALQVRVAQIDEELRQIRGLIEQTQFQNKQTAAELKKLSEDVDFRLRSIEQKQAQGEENTAPTAATPEKPSTVPAADATKPATYKPEAAKTEPPSAAAATNSSDSNSQYSHAFRLLNEKKFTEAATEFDSFVKKYPSDPLTANAYYWLGESHYARKDFTRSTESFRKGFEANPEGQKAPDNLYKLAMSLSQIKRTNEACVVLARVVEKYSETAARTAAKATEARTSLQCK